MSVRRLRAMLALPVVLASGCLLIAPPEDLPALGAGAQGGGGGSGGSAGIGGAEMGGTGMTPAGTGGGAGESAGEGGRETSGGVGGTGGNGGTGEVGGSATAGRGGSNGNVAGTSGSAGEGGAPGCTTNEECVVAQNASEAARCRPSDHTCVTLKTADCPIAYAGENGAARFSDPNAIFVGSMVALDPNFADKSANAWALELAIDEINSAGGLPDPSGGPARPLVLLVCQSDTNTDSKVVERGITHLGEEVQVQALVAELRPDDLTDAFNRETGRQLFYLNAVAVSSALALRDNNGGLIWTLLGEPRDYAAAYALLLSDLETYVRAERGLSPADEIKVATVYTNDAFDLDLFKSADPTLKFNTFPAESQVFDGTNPDGKYLRINLSSLPGDIHAQIQATAEQIVAFAPDIVISTAGDPMTTSGDVAMDGSLKQDGVLELVEAAMPDPRPYYILSPYNAGTSALAAVQSTITTDFATDPSAAGRFMGISAAAAPSDQLDPMTGFASRFITRYGGSVDLPGQVDNYYDAVYYLAYAMYAASVAGDVTGPTIAGGMQQLIGPEGMQCGDTPCADGPRDFKQIFTALANKDKIALYSTLGAPDFDPMTGVRPATPGVFCFTWNAGSQVAQHSLDVLRYDADMKTFNGSYGCLLNFPPQ
jgi:hypothetical protein